MSLRWYAEERRRTRTFDSPSLDHDFHSFRIIILRFPRRAPSRGISPSPFLLSFPFFFPPYTRKLYAPSGSSLPASPSLLFSNERNRADDTDDGRCGRGRENNGVSIRDAPTHALGEVSVVKHRHRCKPRFDSVVPARPIAITTIRVKFESERH